MPEENTGNGKNGKPMALLGRIKTGVTGRTLESSRRTCLQKQKNK